MKAVQRLVLTHAGNSYRIGSDRPSFSIGRLAHNDLVLDQDIVSGSHGLIAANREAFVYEDIKSTNGTFLYSEGGSESFLRGEAIILPVRGRLVFGGRAGPEVSFRLAGHDEGMEAGSVEKGLSALRNGDYQGAFRFFETLIGESPDYLPGYYYAGFAASRLEDLPSAILRFEQYLMLRPDDVSVLLDLGKVYERAGAWDKAGHCYKKVAEKEPGNREAGDRLKEIVRFKPSRADGIEKRRTREVLGGDVIATVEMIPFCVTYNLADHGRILTDLVKALKIAWQDTGDKIGFFPTGSIPVRLLGSRGEVSGRTGPEGIVFTVDQKHLGEKPFLSVLVTHEYAHYALGAMTGFSRRLPWWVQEGFAQLVSQNLSPVRLQSIAAISRNACLIPLDAIEAGLGAIRDKDLIRVAYLEAHSAIAYLVKHHGYECIRRIAEAIGKGEKWKQAFSAVGIDHARFEKEWEKWLAESTMTGVIRTTRELGEIGRR